MKKSTFGLYIVIVMFIIAALTSCSAEPLPSNIKTSNKTNEVKYLVEWESNQIEPFMNITIRRKGVDITTNNILFKAYDITVQPGDIVMIGINYKATAPRPECSLKISRYSSVDYSSNVYCPDVTYNLLEQKTTANGIGFNGIVDEKGNIRYN